MIYVMEWGLCHSVTKLQKNVPTHPPPYSILKQIETCVFGQAIFSIDGSLKVRVFIAGSGGQKFEFEAITPSSPLKIFLNIFLSFVTECVHLDGYTNNEDWYKFDWTIPNNAPIIFA